MKEGKRRMRNDSRKEVMTGMMLRTNEQEFHPRVEAEKGPAIVAAAVTAATARTTSPGCWELGAGSEWGGRMRELSASKGVRETNDGIGKSGTSANKKAMGPHHCRDSRGPHHC